MELGSSSPPTLMPQNLLDFQTGHSKDDLAWMKHGIHDCMQSSFSNFTPWEETYSLRGLDKNGFFPSTGPTLKYFWGPNTGVREGPGRTVIPGTIPNPYIGAATTRLQPVFGTWGMRVQFATPSAFSRQAGNSGFSDEPTQMENFPHLENTAPGKEKCLWVRFGLWDPRLYHHFRHKAVPWQKISQLVNTFSGSHQNKLFLTFPWLSVPSCFSSSCPFPLSFYKCRTPESYNSGTAPSSWQ